MKLRLNNLYAYLSDIPAELLSDLDDQLSYRIKGSYFSPAFRKRRWDGKEHLLRFGKRVGYYTFLGLLPDIEKFCKEREIPLHIETTRRPQGESHVDCHWNPAFVLRDYQREAVNAALESKNRGRGILWLPVRSGKTLIAARIIKELGVKTCFVVNSKLLLDQAFDRLSEYLPGAWVGKIGDGAWEPRDITIASIQTLSSRLRTPECESFLRDGFDLMIVDECLAAYTRIFTPKGIQELGDLKVGDSVLTPYGSSKIRKVWRVRKEAIRYKTQSGRELIASSDHLVPTILQKRRGDKDGTWRGKWVEKPISEVDNLLLWRGVCRELEFDWNELLIGWYIGDGCWTPSTGFELQFGFSKDAEAVSKRLIDIGLHLGERPRVRNNSRGDTIIVFPRQFAEKFLGEFGFAPGPKTNTVEIPKSLIESASVGVIKGLYEAEGNFREDRISLDMTSKTCVRQLMLMLGRYGIHGSLNRYSRQVARHHDRFRLALFGADISNFEKLIGVPAWKSYTPGARRYGPQSAQPSPPFGRIVKEDKIVSKESIGQRDLVDIELEDSRGLFFAGGFVVHNCHHLEAAKWRKPILEADCYYKFGLSATVYLSKERENEKKSIWLKAAAGDVLYSATLDNLIEQGYIMQPTVIIHEIREPDLGKREWKRSVANEAITENEFRNRRIAEYATEYNLKGYSVLITTNRKSQMYRIHELLIMDQRIPICQMIWGDTPMQNRHEIIAQFRANSGILIGTVFGEGIDIPEVECVINAAGGSSWKGTAQRLRNLTLKEGKRAPVIIDFADLTHPILAKHSLDRLKFYKSQGTFIKKVEREKPPTKDLH